MTAVAPLLGDGSVADDHGTMTGPAFDLALQYAGMIESYSLGGARGLDRGIVAELAVGHMRIRSELLEMA